MGNRTEPFQPNRLLIILKLESMIRLEVLWKDVELLEEGKCFILRSYDKTKRKGVLVKIKICDI